MRKLTGQFISMTDCHTALALSNQSIYDAILLLHDRKIKSFTDILKLNCRNLKGYRRACTIKATRFIYKKTGANLDRWELTPTCVSCFEEEQDDPNLVATFEQFKRIINGEDFNEVCPEITAFQVIDS